MNHWKYKGNSEFEVPEGAFGFVYLISGPDGRKYIGRKYLSRAKTSTKRVLLKSGIKVTKKKKSRVESDWMTYAGSCKPLLESISQLGKENFQFVILGFGFTRGQVNFMEIVCQIKVDVMIDPNYYNDAVGSGQFRAIKFSDQFKEVLKEIEL